MIKYTKGSNNTRVDVLSQKSKLQGDKEVTETILR